MQTSDSNPLLLDTSAAVALVISDRRALATYRAIGATVELIT